MIDADAFEEAVMLASMRKQWDRGRYNNTLDKEEAKAHIARVITGIMQMTGLEDEEKQMLFMAFIIGKVGIKWDLLRDLLVDKISYDDFEAQISDETIKVVDSFADLWEEHVTRAAS